MLLALVLLPVLFIGGCGAPAPKAYSISIRVDDPVVGTTFEVDLIGANALTDKPKYENCQLADYWKPGSSLRRDADKVTFLFGQGKDTTQVYALGDPTWSRWLAPNRGVSNIVVMVNLPRNPARITIPLDPTSWPKGTTTIQLLVQETGITTM
jgi:hypothetical protein